MKLLVVTPTLGLSPWLEETVASVATHAVGELHVLVSPPEATAGLARRFPQLRIVAERAGGGMYAAINAGLAVAGDWDAFTYLNDDDLLLPDFARIVAAVGTTVADFHRDARVIYGGVRLVGADGRRLGAIPISSQPGLNRALYAQRLEPVYQHGTVATRAVVEKLGGFDPALKFCGDSEFLARACVSGTGFVCATRREVAAFRLRPGQLTKNRGPMIAERVRVDAKLGLLSARPADELRRARWRFRTANWRVYAERIARHGFVSFDEMLARLG